MLHVASEQKLKMESQFTLFILITKLYGQSFQNKLKIIEPIFFQFIRETRKVF